MPDQEQRARERARRAQQFQDIEDSLARAADLIDQSRREVARSRQIMKDADAAADRVAKESSGTNGT